MKTYLLKIMAIVFMVLFVVSAVLQYNDPDPFLWYAIYGLAALVSAMYFFGRLPRWMAVVLGLLFIAGGVLSWPSQFEGVTIGGGDIRNIEEGREALGLFITAVVMLVYALTLRSAGKTV